MKKFIALFVLIALIGATCMFYSQNTNFDQQKTVNDVTRLNPTPVRGVVTAKSIADIQAAVRGGYAPNFAPFGGDCRRKIANEEKHT